MKDLDNIQKLQKENGRLEKELGAVNNRLEKILRQKDEFISMAAHELRAPMTAIKGYISMLLSGDGGELPDKARGYLLDTNSISDRIIRLVNNMLNVSRIEEGRVTYQMKKGSLLTIAKQVYEQSKFEAQRKGLKYTLEAESDINDLVFVDPDRLYEVIDNLVSNAIKYTNSGSVRITITNPNDKYVRLEVIDTGPGISSVEQRRLFKKFYRVKTTVGKTIGTGLGLYISKLLVERFDGTMGLESSIDRGTTFWFELPLESKTSS